MRTHLFRAIFDVIIGTDRDAPINDPLDGTDEKAKNREKLKNIFSIWIPSRLNQVRPPNFGPLLMLHPFPHPLIGTDCGYKCH